MPLKFWTFSLCYIFHCIYFPLISTAAEKHKNRFSSYCFHTFLLQSKKYYYYIEKIHCFYSCFMVQYLSFISNESITSGSWSRFFLLKHPYTRQYFFFFIIIFFFCIFYFLVETPRNKYHIITSWIRIGTDPHSQNVKLLDGCD